jgi:parvulin-like peptidyl-prolyl isomerase
MPYNTSVTTKIIFTIMPIKKALFSLKEGDYTHSPVETKYGFHIFKIEDIREPQVKPFK